MYVQVNIGRCVGGTPMSDAEWGEFQLLIVDAIQGFQTFLNPSAPAVSFEVHTSGEGSWNGQCEESAHISTIIDYGASVSDRVMSHGMTYFQRDLRTVAARFGQEAVALLIGSKILATATLTTL